jgi:hypothetical protein
MILFGLCNIITTWCAAYTVYLAVPHDLEGWKNFPECVVIVLFFVLGYVPFSELGYTYMVSIISGCSVKTERCKKS